MPSTDYKKVSDPVHGTVGLSELEMRTVDTKVYQRLRNVRHLGLVSQVFPGADYSRFAHCIGSCHITGRILRALRENCALEISEDEEKLYRLAALVHDIGHYPFSHPTEDAVRDYYSQTLLKPNAGGAVSLHPAKGDQETDMFLEHEHISEEIVIHDPELRSVFNWGKIDPVQIASVILREQPPRFSNLISSDLDSDRIDYLLRTAHHTGLPYGSVDVDYLLSQMRVDTSQRICLTNKALRAIDHFLLCRYFDYQQIEFHKTVAASELVLKDVIKALLSNGLIDCSRHWVSEAINSGVWHQFDDLHIINKIRDLYNSTRDDIVRIKTRSLLERKPPKLVYTIEILGDRETDKDTHRLRLRNIRNLIGGLAERFSIPRDLWYVWNRNMPITKIGSHVSTSAAYEHRARNNDDYEQEVRILDRSGSSIPIVEMRESLMWLLSNSMLYSLRLYVLFPDGDEMRKQQREEIRSEIIRLLED